MEFISAKTINVGAIGKEKKILFHFKSIVQNSHVLIFVVRIVASSKIVHFVSKLRLDRLFQQSSAFKSPFAWNGKHF